MLLTAKASIYEHNLYEKLQKCDCIRARAFRSDYEGGVFYEGGGKDGGTQPTITPLINGPPNEGHLYGGGGGGEFIIRGGEVTYRLRHGSFY